MKILKFLVVLLIIIGLAAFGYFGCIKKQNEKIKLLEDKIALLKAEHIPIRFKIDEKTADSITLAIKFYNADNKEINKIKTTIAGQELSFDFYVLPVNDRYVAFPSKIFSNVIAASKGISLYNFYDNKGFPEVFDSESVDPDVYEGLKEVFQQLKNGQMDSIDNYFGNMVHDIKDFKSFLPGTVYSIVTHTKGGIEIVED